MSTPTQGLPPWEEAAQHLPPWEQAAQQKNAGPQSSASAPVQAETAPTGFAAEHPWLAEAGNLIHRGLDVMSNPLPGLQLIHGTLGAFDSTPAGKKLNAAVLGPKEAAKENAAYNGLLPPGPMENVGHMVGQGAAMQLAGDGLGALGEKLAPYVPEALAKIAPIAGRIARGALSAGGVTALEGNNPTGPALLGGTGAAAAEAAPAIANALNTSGENQYLKFLNPTTRATKFAARSVVPSMIRAGVGAGAAAGAAKLAHLPVGSAAIGGAASLIPGEGSVPSEDTSIVIPGLLERGVVAHSLQGLSERAVNEMQAANQALDQHVNSLISDANRPNLTRLALPPARVAVGLPGGEPSPAPMAFEPQRGTARGANGQMARTFGSDIAEAPPLQRAQPAIPETWDKPVVERNAQGQIVRLPPPVNAAEPTKVLRDPGTGRMGRAPLSQIRPGVAAVPEIPGTARPLPHTSEWGTAPRDERLATAIRSEPAANPGVVFRREAPAPGPAIERPLMATKPLHDALERYKQRFMVNGIPTGAPGEAAINAAQGLQDFIQKHGEYVSLRSLRSIRQQLDAPLAEKNAFLGKALPEASSLNAQKELANSIRAELAKQSPEMARLNAEFNFWSKVHDVAKASAERKGGQQGLANALGIPVLATGAGAAMGGTPGALEGAAAAALSQLFRSPTWRTVSAITKNRMANLLAQGNAAGALRLIGTGAAAASASSQNAQAPKQKPGAH